MLTSSFVSKKRFKFVQGARDSQPITSINALRKRHAAEYASRAIASPAPRPHPQTSRSQKYAALSLNMDAGPSRTDEPFMTYDPFSEGSSKRMKLVHPPLETDFFLCDPFEEFVRNNQSKVGPPKSKNKRNRAKPVSGHRLYCLLSTSPPTGP